MSRPQALSDCLRAELASSGIAITVVSPGYVRTSLSFNAGTAEGGSHGGRGAAVLHYEVLSPALCIVMDANQLGGYEPEFVAGVIADASELRQTEIVLAPVHHR